MNKNEDKIIELLNFITVKISDNLFNDLTAIIYPIYYLFDKDIDENIGCTVEARNKIREYYDLDKKFNLNSTNIINIYNSGHSTILYKLEINDKKYIYYSNSGLGINNNIRFNGNVIPKIFYINDTDILTNLCEDINFFIENILNNKLEYLKYASINEEIIKLIHKNIITKKIFSKIKEHEIKYIYDDTKIDKNQNGIFLCYTLLYYIASNYQNDFKECSICDIISEVENINYNDYLNIDIINLYNNCKGINNVISTKIYNSKISLNNNSSKYNSSKYNFFKIFIEKINSKIDIEFNTNSLKHVKEYYKVKFNLLGLYNKEQSSGSCVFYSYFNLGVNNLLLTLFFNNEINEESKINKFIENTLSFHNSMINLLCISNDTKYIFNKKYTKYEKNNFFNNNYIYELINKYSLNDEISNYYSEETLIFNKNKPGIDKLFNSKIYGEIEVNDIELIDYTFYIYLHRFLKTKVIEVRNYEGTFENFKINFPRSDFTDFYTYIRPFLDRIPIDFGKNTNMYEVLLDIYYIYLVILKYISINPHIVNFTLNFSNNIKYYYFYYNNNKPITYDRIDLYEPLFFLFDYHEIINIFKFTSTYNKNINDILKLLDISINSNNIKNIKYTNKIFLLLSYKRYDINDILYSIENSKLDDNKKLYQYFYAVYNSIEDNKGFNINTKEFVELINDIEILNKYKNIKNKIICSNKQLVIYTNSYIHIIHSFKDYDITPFCLNDLLLCSLKIDNLTKLYSTKSLYSTIENKWKIIIKQNILNLSPTFIEDLLLYDTFENKKYNWISNINNLSTTDYISYIYNSKSYISLNIKYNTNIYNILNRFSITDTDLSNVKLLFNELHIDNEAKIIKDNISGYFFILTSKNFILSDKIIQIYFENNYINSDKIYIIDENNIKQKLYFNLTIDKHPFLPFIPVYLPYLCYYNKEINNYSLTLLSSSNFYRNFLNKYDRSFNKNFMNIDFKEDLKLDLKIAPSYFCPINNFNIDIYKKICDRYSFNIKLNITLDIFYRIQVNEHKNDFYNNLIEKIKIYCINNIDYKNNNSIFLNDINSKINIKNGKNNYINKHKFCLLKKNIDLKFLNNTKDYLYIAFNKNIQKIKKYDNFNRYFKNNIDIFTNIMKYNILIELINKIIKNNSCWELNNYIDIIDSILYFNKKVKDNFFYKFEIFYLIQLPYFYKKSQLNKYIEIRTELIKKEKELKLHQFMMGKGKTSVFTPLLSICIIYYHKKIATVITASHLVSDTSQYLALTEYLTNIKVNIYSDYDAKLRWIKNYDLSNNEKIDLKNEFNIIDEFDSHYNYLSSMFNLVKENDKVLDKEIFNFIFDFIYFNEKNINNEFINNNLTIKYPYLLNNLNFFYINSKKSIYNMDYGFSFLYFEDEKYDINRLCSPFLRKDTPIKNSKFSSILYTLILTFKVYINNECKLNNDLMDFNNIFNIISKFKNIDPKIDYFIINYDEDSNEKDMIEELKNIFKEIYDKNNIKINIRILLIYLYNVNKEQINYVKTQLNISFQDLIYNTNEQWQVGYTGTAYLELFNYNNIKEYVFSNKIIYDSDEKFDILFAIYGYGKPDILDKSKIHFINLKEKPISICNILKSISNNISNNKKYIKKILKIIENNPRGFIDLHGLFLNNDNIEIAQIISEELPKYNIVFLDKNNNKLQLKDGITKKFKKSFDNNFYYYDQCHVIGTDIEQPQEGHVAILINTETKMSDFAQAIFRFRKLNKGTYLSIIVINNKNNKNNIKNVEDIYNLLIENQNIFKLNQKNGIKLQILKAITRKNSKNYKEIDLQPEFNRNEEINIEKIMKNNIFKKNKKNNTNNTNNTNNIIINKNINEEEKRIVKNLYNELKESNELKKLILGTGNERTLSLTLSNEQEKEKEKEQEQEQEQEQEKILFFYNEIKNNSEKISKKINLIKHLNCERCKKESCIKIFETQHLKINNKNLYISYNFLSNFSFSNFCSCYLKCLNNNSAVFIEFNDMILIELYTIGLLYYSNKLPVYLFETGKIINPILANNYNNNRFILDIDPIIIEIFGLKKYLNPLNPLNKFNNNKNNIYYINDINNYALYILKIMLENKLKFIIESNNIKIFIKYYYLSDYFKEKIKNLKLSNIHKNINNINNIHNTEYDIYQLFFYTHLPLQKYNFILNTNKLYINNITNTYLPKLIQIYRDFLNENNENNIPSIKL